MTKYEGLCVGGPYDGKWLSHLSPQYVMVKRQAHPLAYEPDTAVVRMAIPELETMVWFHVYGQDFWIPADKDLGWLMAELSEAYSRLADLND